MKIFLTGGTGFVGSHIADRFVDQGHEVAALVRPTSDVDHLSRLGVTLIEGELGKAGEFADELATAQAVVHVAGLTASADRAKLYAVNVAGTRDLVDATAAVADGSTRFIYMSSVAAQGPSHGTLARDQERPPAPVSAYGRSKLEGEGALLAHRQELRLTIVRPPAIYGPRDADMFQVFALAKRRLAPIMGGEERLLSLIHVDDVARAIEACLDAPGEAEIYPIDDGGVHSWRALGEAVAQAVGTRTLTIPVPPSVFAGAAALSELGGRLVGRAPTFDRDKFQEMRQSSWVCGHEAITRDLGWKPNYDLRQGAQQTAKWYREQGWL